MDNVVNADNGIKLGGVREEGSLFISQEAMDNCDSMWEAVIYSILESGENPMDLVRRGLRILEQKGLIEFTFNTTGEWKVKKS